MPKRNRQVLGNSWDVSCRRTGQQASSHNIWDHLFVVQMEGVCCPVRADHTYFDKTEPVIKENIGKLFGLGFFFFSVPLPHTFTTAFPCFLDNRI